MSKEKELSSKSTKNELFDAYNELLEKVKNQSSQDRKSIKETEEKTETVRVASLNSDEKIVKNIAELKLNIGSSLDKMEELLMTEYKKLTKLQDSIKIEKQNLSDLYEITSNVHSLEALIQAQKEKKNQFEEEMETKKNEFDIMMKMKKQLWENEQKEKDQTLKEQESQYKKQKQREEDENNYTLQLTRKKEQDTYDAKKDLKEKELAEKIMTVEKNLTEREFIIAAKEKEYAEMKSKVDNFPKELEKSLKDAEKTVTEKMERTYKFEAELKAMEIEGAQKLKEQIITTLQSKIKEQETLVAQLTTKADSAGAQVKDIAVKAIEGASATRYFNQHNEKKEDSSKN
jgi:hypothetical protein